VRRIIRIGSTLLLAVAAFTVAGFGVVGPAATAAGHPVKFAPVRPAWSGTGIACDQDAPSLCMDMGSGGVGDPVKAFAYSGNSSQLLQLPIQSGECNDGLVTEGPDPCPFSSGTGLNTLFNGSRIVELTNPTYSANYAATSSGGIDLKASGDGQIWVQVGPINSSSYGNLVNVYYSDAQGGEAYVACDTGNSGGDLFMMISTDETPGNCFWSEQ
jgi:hypothetical protein